MTRANLSTSSRSRARRPGDQRRLALHITWLEAKARRGLTFTISAAFAREMARTLRQLVHAGRAA